MLEPTEATNPENLASLTHFIRNVLFRFLLKFRYIPPIYSF